MEIQNLEVVFASMYVTKAAQDPKTGEMRWQCTSSDTLPDQYDDEMTVELYQSFIDRIESGELVPEAYRSEFWQGGMPYVSLSHYSDGNGANVPGMVTSLYIDGNKLKAKGIMNDTPLGRASFKALQETLNQKSLTREPVRVSIGFLDYAHEHKATGTKFIRKNISDVCPECLKMYQEQGKLRGLRYLSGHLIHKALTRVPVNPRTLMEIDRAMTTQKEDAASIVGEELAEQIDAVEAELNVPQKALVTKSEESTAVDTVTNGNYVQADSGVAPLGSTTWMASPLVDLSPVLDRINALEETFKSLLTVKPEPHVLDAVIADFKSAYDGVDKSRAENLQSLNPVWEQFASVVKASFGTGDGTGSSDTSVADMVKSEVQAAVQPLLDGMAILTEQLKSQSVQTPGVPVQRGITQLVVNDPAKIARSQGEQNRPLTLREQIRQSVGL